MRESSEEQPFDQMDDSGLSVPAMQEESPGLMYGQSYTSEHGVDDFPQSSSEAATQGLSWNYLLGNEFASLHQEDASFPRDATTMRSQKKRVIIIDRWRLLRGPLSAWLNAFNLEFQPIVVPSIQAASEYQAEATPAAVVLCAQPASCDQSWLDAQIAYLRNKASDLPIVVIGDGTDAVGVAEMVANGGLQSYVPTTSSTAIALAALHVATAGGSYYPPLPAPALEQSAPSAMANPALRTVEDPHLTPREHMVFALLARGLPNKLIAFELDLSISTVKIHVHHIIRKLKVHNRTEAAILAREIHQASGVDSTGQRNGATQNRGLAAQRA